MEQEQRTALVTHLEQPVESRLTLNDHAPASTGGSLKQYHRTGVEIYVTKVGPNGEVQDFRIDKEGQTHGTEDHLATTATIGGHPGSGQGLIIDTPDWRRPISRCSLLMAERGISCRIESAWRSTVEPRGPRKGVFLWLFWRLLPRNH